MNEQPDKPDVAEDTVSPGSTSEPSSPSPKSGEYTLGTVCHLLSLIGFLGIPFGNIIGPLVLWIVKRQEDSFLDQTGKEVLNFQISMTIYVAIAALLIFAFIGIVLLPVLLIANLVYTIIAAIKSSEGTIYHYPFTISLIK